MPDSKNLISFMLYPRPFRLLYGYDTSHVAGRIGFRQLKTEQTAKMRKSGFILFNTSHLHPLLRCYAETFPELPDESAGRSVLHRVGNSVYHFSLFQ